MMELGWNKIFQQHVFWGRCFVFFWIYRTWLEARWSTELGVVLHVNKYHLGLIGRKGFRIAWVISPTWRRIIWNKSRLANTEIWWNLIRGSKSLRLRYICGVNFCVSPKSSLFSVRLAMRWLQCRGAFKLPWRTYWNLKRTSGRNYFA